MNYENILNILIERGKTRVKIPGDFMNKHRIIPGYRGGEYTPDNITLLTRKEHRIVHKILHKLHGNWEDLSASRFLGGKLSDESVNLIRRNAGVKGGKTSGRLNRELKRGIFARSFQEMSEHGKRNNAVLREQKRGIYGLTHDELAANSRKGCEIKKIKKDLVAQRDHHVKAYIKHQQKLAVSSAASERYRIIGQQHAETGHTARIAHLGGAQHKGRRRLINPVTKQIKRPTKEVEAALITSGEWIYYTDYSD